MSWLSMKVGGARFWGLSVQSIVDEEREQRTHASACTNTGGKVAPTRRPLPPLC